MIKKIIILLFFAICFSCNSKHSVTIKGTFDNMPETKFIIEKRGVLNNLFLDSVKTNKQGKFKTKIDVHNVEPAFISIKNGNGKQIVMLLAENGENIEFSYNRGKISIKGSQGSEFVNQLNETLVVTEKSLDSLRKIMDNKSLDKNEIDTAGNKLAKKFIEQKRKSIKFIINNPKSYASIYALYQQFTNGVRLFGTAGDFLFYKAIIDSMDSRYANCEYMKVVKRDYENLQNAMDFQNKFGNKEIKEVSYPDLDLPDKTSKKIKLSSLEGKTIIVSFWSSAIDGWQMDNKHLLDLYDKYNAKGLEIYNISIDTERDIWLRAINMQKLPFINVCDFTGTRCLALGLYNVQKIPSNFIIDKSGKLVGRDLFGKDLDKKMEQIFK